MNISGFSYENKLSQDFSFTPCNSSNQDTKKLFQTLRDSLQRESREQQAGTQMCCLVQKMQVVLEFASVILRGFLGN